MPHAGTGTSPGRPGHPRTSARGRAPRPRTRGRPAPARPARPPARAPGPPQPSAHHPSRSGRRMTPDRRADTPGMRARPGRTPQAGTGRRRGPSMAVRETADGAHRPSDGNGAVRYVSVDTATRRSTPRQGDTRRDTEETARIAENPQLSGRFPRVWQVLGSNQRRLSRRFYRPPSSTASYMPSDLRIRCSRRRFDAIAPPCVSCAAA
jgi:hypothetical protein